MHRGLDVPQRIVGKAEVNSGHMEDGSLLGKLEETPDVLHGFRTSFFSTSRLASFPWTTLDNELERSKSSDVILEVLKVTCLDPLCRRFPPSVRFRKRFLTELIRRQEAVSCQPLDELYDALAEVVGAQDTAEGYKSYLLPSGEAVSLLENVALITHGTTGLVTWNSALYLAEWALDQQETFSGRTVLELGSGLGLTGVTICRSCRPSRYVFTDCHPNVLQRLKANVRLNGLTDGTTPGVSVEELDWTEATEERLQKINADVVIAADVVYDPEVAASLVTLLAKILRCSSPQIFICSTIRIPKTYSDFKKQLGDAGIHHQVLTAPPTHVFPDSRTSTVEMILLCNKPL